MNEMSRGGEAPELTTEASPETTVSKQDIIEAIRQRNSDALVKAMQEMRRYLFDLEGVRRQMGDKAADLRDTLHIRNGWWKRSFEAYFERIDQAGRGDIEVYLDGVSRIVFHVDGDNIDLIIAQVSNPSVKERWATLNS